MIAYYVQFSYSWFITYSILQEKLQKEAFETLMLQKDAKTQRITSQIELIEQELAQLTLLEVEQRDMRLDTQMVQNDGFSRLWLLLWS